MWLLPICDSAASALQRGSPSLVDSSFVQGCSVPVGDLPSRQWVCMPGWPRLPASTSRAQPAQPLSTFIDKAQASLAPTPHWLALARHLTSLDQPLTRIYNPTLHFYWPDPHFYWPRFLLENLVYAIISDGSHASSGRPRRLIGNLGLFIVVLDPGQLGQDCHKMPAPTFWPQDASKPFH